MKKNQLVIPVILIFACLTQASPANSAEFEWKVTTLSGEKFQGFSQSFTEAEANIQTACESCKYITAKTSGDGVSYRYDSQPNYFDATYMSWRYSDLPSATGGDTFSSLDAYLSFKRQNLLGASSPGCPNATVTSSGSWANVFNPPYIPLLSDGLCTGNVNYSNLLTCDGGVKVTIYLGASCVADARTNTVYRSRGAEECPDDLNLGTKTTYVDGVAVERKLACFTGGVGIIIAPLSYSACKVGNPCNVATGEKLAAAVDFSASGLTFERFYNSRQTLNSLSIGRAWRHSFSDELILTSQGRVSGVVWTNGKLTKVTYRAGTYTVATVVNSISDVSNINQVGDEWHVTRKNDNTRVYRSDGKLIRIEKGSGEVTQLGYNSGSFLTSITDHYGNSIDIEYQGRLISRATFPDNTFSEYRYDEQQRLISIIHPNTGSNNVDGPTTVYHYEDNRFPYHLTGITDENGDRNATYAYDSDGLAITTEHAQTTNSTGQEKFELDYQGAN